MKFKWNKTTLIITFWILFITVDFLKKPSSFSNLNRAVWLYLAGYLLWIILTIPLNKIFDWSARKGLLKRVGILLVVAIIAGSTKAIANWCIYYFGIYLSIGKSHSGGLLKFMTFITLFYFVEAVIIATVLMVVFFVVELYHKYKEEALRAVQLESQLAKAQLQTLKMQLQPHFLFNVNNTISMLVRKGENEKAVNMIAGLSDLLRLSLERENHQLVQFKEELNLLKKYLEIELFRFEDRLEVKFDIQEDVLPAMVPSFLLQPLLENAFKHGIAKSIGHAFIELKVSKIEKYLNITLFNSGPQLELNNYKTGIGISNTQKRLDQLYPDTNYFNVLNKNNGVIVEIKIPYSVKATNE